MTVLFVSWLLAVKVHKWAPSLKVMEYKGVLKLVSHLATPIPRQVHLLVYGFLRSGRRSTASPSCVRCWAPTM